MDGLWVVVVVVVVEGIDHTFSLMTLRWWGAGGVLTVEIQKRCLALYICGKNYSA